MAYGLLLLAMVGLVVSLLLGDDGADLPPAEQRAVAEALLVHHERALLVAAATPALVGVVPVPALTHRVAGAVSCTDGRTVATRLDPALPRSASEDRRLLVDLAVLQFTALGVGRASGGLLASPVATYTLPCAVPDGTPVVATLVRP